MELDRPRTMPLPNCLCKNSNHHIQQGMQEAASRQEEPNQGVAMCWPLFARGRSRARFKGHSTSEASSAAPLSASESMSFTTHLCSRYFNSIAGYHPEKLTLKLKHRKLKTCSMHLPIGHHSSAHCRVLLVLSL